MALVQVQLMLLEPPPRCKGSKDRPLVASPSSAITHLTGGHDISRGRVTQGLKQTGVFRTENGENPGFLCKQPSSPLHDTSSPWSQDLHPSVSAASFPPSRPSCLCPQA